MMRCASLSPNLCTGSTRTTVCRNSMLMSCCRKSRGFISTRWGIRTTWWSPQQGRSICLRRRSRVSPARSPNRGGAGAPWNRLDVTKEMRPSPLSPVRRIVRSEAWARTEHAEKGMLIGIDHNPSMSAPHGQVPRSGTCDSSKFYYARLEVRRARVFIRQTGELIDSVDKVGAVESKLSVIAGIQGNIQNLPTLTPSQRPGADRLLLQARSLTTDSISPGGTCLLLFRQCETGSGHAEQEKYPGALGMEPHSPLL